MEKKIYSEPVLTVLIFQTESILDSLSTEGGSGGQVDFSFEE